MKKGFVLLAVIFIMAVRPIQNVQACEASAVVQIDKGSADVQRADVIVIKYRTNNGVLQYRRWNETRGYWVDPDWIDLS